MKGAFEIGFEISYFKNPPLTIILFLSFRKREDCSFSHLSNATFDSWQFFTYVKRCWITIFFVFSTVAAVKRNGRVLNRWLGRYSKVLFWFCYDLIWRVLIFCFIVAEARELIVFTFIDFAGFKLCFDLGCFDFSWIYTKKINWFNKL